MRRREPDLTDIGAGGQEENTILIDPAILREKNMNKNRLDKNFTPEKIYSPIYPMSPESPESPPAHRYDQAVENYKYATTGTAPINTLQATEDTQGHSAEKLLRSLHDTTNSERSHEQARSEALAAKNHYFLLHSCFSMTSLQERLDCLA